jgi:hypothetical protein
MKKSFKNLLAVSAFLPLAFGFVAGQTDGDTAKSAPTQTLKKALPLKNVLTKEQEERKAALEKKQQTQLNDLDWKLKKEKKELEQKFQYDLKELDRKNALEKKELEVRQLVERQKMEREFERGKQTPDVVKTTPKEPAKKAVVKETPKKKTEAKATPPKKKK